MENGRLAFREEKEEQPDGTESGEHKSQTERWRRYFNCSRSHPGRSVVMPSTPASTRRRATCGSLTVQTTSLSPAAWTVLANASSMGHLNCRSRPSKFAAFAWASKEASSGSRPCAFVL